MSLEEGYSFEEIYSTLNLLETEARGTPGKIEPEFSFDLHYFRASDIIFYRNDSGGFGNSNSLPPEGLFYIG